ncbi:hypothetical protein NDU88_008000 [Pleurodeles waltl]|uniref:Uncharacterized protein n=1 Tax=Pleurodeles waltl TaxID=8319 RepID=A0AAV7N3R9_PLEWA|nr:hypothetical protein NDU88_008000 [Pleurodeles waltl]
MMACGGVKSPQWKGVSVGAGLRRRVVGWQAYPMLYPPSCLWALRVSPYRWGSEGVPVCVTVRAISVGVRAAEKRGQGWEVGAAVRCAPLIAGPLVADPVAPGEGRGLRRGWEACYQHRATSCSRPRRQSAQGAGRSGGRVPLPRAPTGDASLRAGLTPHSRPRLGGLPRASNLPLPLRSASPGRALPRVTGIGRSASRTSTPAPAAFGGPLVRLQHRRPRRVAHRRAELGP